MNSNSSITGKDLDLTQFSVRFLKEKGAVLEFGNEVVDALLPKSLSYALDVEEYISLAKDAQSIENFGGQKCYSIQFQSPLLDRIVSMAGLKPPFLQADLKFHYIKTQGFANLIMDQFEFYKSKIKVTGTADIITRYILLTCRFLAQSDEQKQGLLDFSFNLETGALAPGMSGMMINAEKQYQTKNIQGYSKEEIKRIHERVSFYGPGAVEQELSEFVKSMNRRFKRDSASLDQYYNDLEKEMKESLSRTGISDKLIQERKAKIAMIPDELAAKKKDLLNKYSIRVSFVPVATLAVTTPCVKVFATLVSGHQKIDVSMMYNPVTKQMDPMVCQSCGMSMYSLGLCKNMHLNCITCLNQGCTLCQ
jgi:hypothetical protein